MGHLSGNIETQTEELIDEITFDTSGEGDPESEEGGFLGWLIVAAIFLCLFWFFVL